MKFKISFLCICLIFCLFAIASVCASEVNDTAISEIDSDDNLEINEDNQVIEKIDNLAADDSNDNSLVIEDSSNESQDDNIEVSAPESVKNSDSDELKVSEDDVVGADLKAEVIPINVSVEDDTLFVIDCDDDFNGNVSIKVGDDLLYNSSVKPLIKANKLYAGNYTAVAVFYGDSNYEDLTLNEIKFTVSKVTPSIDVDIKDLTYPRSAVAIINLSNNANGTVNVTVGKKSIIKTVLNGKVSVELSNLSAGYKDAKIEFFSDDNYNNDVVACAKFISYPNNSLVTMKYNPVFYVGEDIEMEIKTYNSTGDLKIILNGQYYNTFHNDYLRVYEVDFGELGVGTYTVTVSLDGDENYTGYSTSGTFNVVKNDLTIDLNEVGDICVDSPVTFTAKLGKEVTGDVIFNINGINYTVYVDNEDTAIYTYTPANNSTLHVSARFMGNDIYNANESALKQFNVSRIATFVDMSFYHINAGDDAIIEVSMNPEITCAAMLSVNSKNYDVAIVDGKGMYTVINLADGIYDVKVTFEGDDRYAGSVSDVKQLFVNKVITNLNISIDKTSMSYYDVAVVNVVLNHSMNAVVTVKVNGRNHTVGLVNGKGSFTLYDLDKGNYTINAVFAGDDRYVQSISNTLNLTVTGDNVSSSVSISLNKPSVIVGEEVIITVTSNPTVTGIIRLNIGSESYNVAVNRGVGTFTISDLANGTYDVQAIFDGDNKHLSNSSEVKQLEVSRIPTNLSISIDNDLLFVGDSVVVGVVLNQAINNVVTVKVNDNDYIIGIVNGRGNLTLNALTFGTCTVNAVFAGEGKYAESASGNVTLNVNKIKTSLAGDAITATYNVNKYLVITLKDSKGNAIANTKVTVDLNGVKTLTTDNNGQIKVSTSGLAPKAYTAKITFNGNSVYDKSSKNVKVTVKKANPNIVAKAKTFKVKVKTKKYSMTLKDNTGKAIKKAAVSLKVYGKTYKATTDSKGKATFSIKNLKKKGNYDAVITYDGNGFYNKLTNKVKIKIS